MAMTGEYPSKRCLLLWLKCYSRKRSNACDSVLPPTKRAASVYDKVMDKMLEVDEILTKLKEHHQHGKYTKEQLRCWAHMLQLKQHDSFDSPPCKPFFKTRASCSSNQSTSVVVSPGKKISLRSKCIDQLDKWHELKERGVIDDEQYQDFKRNILQDRKEF